MKKIVIAPDSFKGTLSSRKACRAIANAAERVFPEAAILCLPLADGGEGTVDCFASLPGSRTETVTVSGPLGERVSAPLVFLPDGSAVIETASAAGLGLAPEKKEPLRSSTFGVGELIRHAATRGARRILLGLGGSCTTDGGAGAACALGVRFLTEQGEAFLPTGASLKQVAKIDTTALSPAVKGLDLILLCDVTAPLFGAAGAAFVFAPQKGASPEDVQFLDESLRHMGAFYDAIRPGTSLLPGAGAAGGLGAGLCALFGGRLSSGIDAVLDAVDGSGALAGTDLIVTGEGKLDEQSLRGKVVSGVARRAGNAPVAVIAGVVDCPEESLKRAGIARAFAVHPAPVPVEIAKKDAFRDLEKAAQKAFLTWKERA